MRLEWKDLSKRFGTRTIFSGISGRVETGEVLIIAGPNGSGKTTLLRVMAGLARPSAGTVTVSNIARFAAPRDCSDQIGFITPDMALYSELSAQENLRFYREVRGLKADASDLQARLDVVGLRDRSSDLVGVFSSGMKQRLKLAFAMLNDPPILLLDEPTSNLDEAGTELVRSLVSRQRVRGLCVLATNDPAERQWGDRIVWMGR